MNFQIIMSDRIPALIPNWDTQLAGLTQKVWTNHKTGQTMFPHSTLNKVETWRTEILTGWIENTIFSWVIVDERLRICAHVALIQLESGLWELGRLMSDPDRRFTGGIKALVMARMNFLRAAGIQAFTEATQGHSKASFLARFAGMKFAGIAPKVMVDGIHWDILFWDTERSEHFVPRKGILADPLGNEILCTPEHRAFLRRIEPIITTERGGRFPPKGFHVLPEVEPIVREIIRLNLDSSSHISMRV